MKRLTAFIIILSLISISIGCSKKHIDYEAKNTSNVEDTQIVDIILFFSDKNSTYLVPEARKAVVENNKIEETILKELIKGPSSKGLSPTMPKGTKLISVNVKDKTAYVNLSREFKDNHSGGSAGEGLTINSIVDSLTELPYINRVQFLVEGKKVESLAGHMDIGSPLTRARYALKRESLNPSEVLKKQMSYEKNGNWLNAYILMSDEENNEYRKYYNEYVKEMEESQKEGFFNADFEVGDFKIDSKNPNKAKVKVNFIVKDENGKTIRNPDLYFNTIKIDGYWMVDWLTAQE